MRKFLIVLLSVWALFGCSEDPIAPDENGFTPPPNNATIGGNAWVDDNDDGVQQPGEDRLPGVIVVLENCAGDSLATTTTAINGVFSFTGLAPADYRLRFALPASFEFAAQGSGGDPETDSDPNPLSGITPCFAAASGANDFSRDVGFRLPNGRSSIAGGVWNDANANGLFDGGESAVAGFGVTLLSCAGDSLAATTTGGDGSYLFDDLLPGSYRVRFADPAPNVFSLQDQGGNDAVDSDANPQTGETDCVAIGSGDTITDIDAGTAPSGMISGRVWNDLNIDGVETVGEPGMNGLSVQLFDCNTNMMLQSVVTGSDGRYTFMNVPSGLFFVRFGLPFGFVFTQQDAGADDTVDSDADAFGNTMCFTLAAAAVDTTIKAGVAESGDITGQVWEDSDGDGLREGGEPALSGVSVQLLNCANQVIATNTTNASGGYTFGSVPPGDYKIRVLLPSGYNYSPMDVGGDDNVDSDVGASDGRTNCFTLMPDATVTIDGGLDPI